MKLGGREVGGVWEELEGGGKHGQHILHRIYKIKKDT